MGKRERPTDSARAYVRVRGLPYSATQEQVRDFFAQSVSLDLADVALRYNACGEAFVRVHAEQLPAALALNKQLMGKRYIDVFQTEQGEFERCESSAGVTDGSKALVRMRGLPWGATMDDITAFFAGHEIVAIRINTRADGRQTGEGYVEFDSEASATAALALHRKEMKGRYIEVFAATKGEMLAVAASHSAAGAAAGTAVQPDEGRVVKVRGLPWAATASDVAVFFSGIPIDGWKNGESAPGTSAGSGSGSGSGILIVTHPDGRSAGEAYVLFEKAEGAAAALKRDKHQMASRWVDVKPSTLAEMMRAGGAAGQAAGVAARVPLWMTPDWAVAHPLELAPHLSTSLQPASPVCVRMRGLAVDQTEESLGAFLRGATPPIPPAAIRLVFRKDQPSGTAYGLFPNENEAARAAAHGSSAAAHPALAPNAANPPEFMRCSLREMLFVCNKMQHQAHVAMAAHTAGGGGAGSVAGFGPHAQRSPYPAVGAVGAGIAPAGYGGLGYGIGPQFGAPAFPHGGYSCLPVDAAGIM